MKRILVLLLVAVAVVGITANCNKVNALRNKHNRFDGVPVEVDTISKFSQELGHFIDSICPTLNGTLIIARHDTILVERAMGYLQLFREATGYDTITYEQLGGLRKQDVNKVTEEAVRRVQASSAQAKQIQAQIKQDKAINNNLAKFLEFLLKNIKTDELMTSVYNTFFKVSDPKT